MIEGSEKLMAYLRSLSKWDRHKALKKAVPLVKADNREGLLAGLDADGHPFPEPITPASQRGGDGPFLVPRGAESRAIANQDLEVSGGEMVVSWEDADFLRYFNVAGIRPKGMAKIVDAVVKDVVKQIEAK